MTFKKRFGPKLDRGQGMHGAKWVYVTPEGHMINYAQLKLEGGQKHDDWLLFKSMKEAKRWIALLGMQNVGHVRNLARQVRFDLLVTRPDGIKEKIGVYVADHVFERRRLNVAEGVLEALAWEKVVEDVKGYREDLYKWKRRHFEAQYGMPLSEF